MSQHMTGGEAVVRSLIKQQVETVFGLPGVQNDWLYNAFYDQRSQIRVIHCRHEQGVAYMALGSFLATGCPSVYSVVPGPGFLNASAALATAYGLGAQVLCLSGQLPRAAIGRGQGVLHEIPDQLGIMRSLTKWADRVNAPGEAALKIAEAFWQLQSGKPQPVGLEVPMDVLAQTGQVDLAVSARAPYYPLPDSDLIEQAAQRLGRARSPLIFVGAGAQGVSAEVTQLAESLQAPVVSYRTGKGVLDSRHYLSVFQPPARQLWEQADAVLAVGSHMRVPLAKWVKTNRPSVIRIDVDPLSHDLFVKPDIAITARAEDALPLLLSRLDSHNHKRVSKKTAMLELRARWSQEVAVLEPQLSYLTVIREALGEDGIFVDELTQVGFASRIAYPVYKPRTYLSTGYQGTLGYGFPTALGAKVARPERPVVSVTGDGGFMFGVQELATAVQHKIGLVTVVFNNHQYGNVQQMQRDLYDNRVIASDLHNPDFVRLAEAFGARGVRAETPDALKRALAESLPLTEPTLIEVPLGNVPSADRFR